MINVIVVTHGVFGQSLIEAAENIIGAHSGVEFVSVSAKASVEEIRAAVQGAVGRAQGGEGLIILTDMLGGTPTNVSFPLVKDAPQSAVISGVNMNMLLSALSYRGKLPLDRLKTKILEDGKKSVCDIKALFAGAGKR